MSRRLRRLAVLVVALAASVVVLVVVLQSGWLRDRLRRLAMSEANKYLSGELTIGRLSGSLLHSVVLDDVHLTQPGGSVLEAPRISVTYDVWTWLHRRFVIGEVTIERPVVRIAQGRDGWNVTQLLKPRPGGGPPMAFQVGTVRVVQGEVTVAPADRASRHLADVNVEAQIARMGGQLSIDIASATFRDDLSGYDVRRASGSLRNGVQSIDLTFAAERSPARLDGHIRTTMAAGGGAQVVAAMDLTNVNLRSFFVDPKWQTTITAHADVQGSVGSQVATTAVTFRLAGPHVGALGYEGTEVAATGQWNGSQLACDASASAYGGAASIQATWHIGGSTPSRFDGAGTFQHVSLPALPTSLRMPPLESQLAGQYQMHYDDSGWRARVSLEDSTVEGASIGRQTIGFIEDHRGVVTYAAAGTIDGLDLRRIAGPLNLSALAADRYRSRLGGRFTISGQELCRVCTVPRLISASVETADARLSDARFTDASATLSLVGAKLTIQGHGEVRNLTAEAMGLPTPIQLDLNGTVDGSVILPDVHAPVSANAIEVTGAARLTSSSLAGVSVDHAQADVSLANGIVTTRELVADASGLHLAAKGSLAVGVTGSSALDLTIDADDLGPLGKLVRQPLAGAGHVDARVTGPHDQPQATGHVSLRQVAYGSDVSALTLNGDLAASMPSWQAPHLTVTVKTEATFVTVKSLKATTVSGRGTYQDYRIDLDARVADATRQLQVAGAIGLAPADRALTIHALTLTTDGQTWALPSGPPATIRLADSHVDVVGLRLAKGPASILIEGAVPVGSASTTAAQALMVSAHQVDLADLDRVVLGTSYLKGLVDAQVTLTGTLDDPHVDAHLSVTNGAIDTTPFASFEGKVTLAAHDLTLDASLVQSGTNRITATGHVPVGTGAFSSPRAMDVSVKSTPIGLGLAELFTTSLSKIGGTAQLNLRLTGSPQAPMVDGTVSVDGGAFTVAASGVSYRNATAALTFKANHLAVDALQLADDDGHELHAVGGLDVFGGSTAQAFDIHVTTNGMHVLNNDLGTLQLSAEVEAKGDLSAPTITGTVTLDSGRLQVDQILNKTTKSAYSETPAGGPLANAAGVGGAAPSGASAVPPPRRLADRIRVDLQFNLPDNLVMRGRNLRVSDGSIGLGDMNVIAGGQLHVVKPTDGHVDVIGDVQFVRGTYSFQGRRFDITRGSAVQFRGADLSNAALNVSADRDLNGVNATVHVTGTPSRPHVTLSSQPPLDEAEILSLLVFGQPVGDLGQSDRTVLANSAAAMAAGAFTNPLADSVARALDLDTFEILAPSATEQVPVVSLGSTIGSRVYIGFKQEVGGSNSAVSFEYRFTRFLRLVTSFAQGALESHVLERSEAAGVDLLFVFRF
jgi:autotransporter translocation and assembly factor TamB